MIGQTVAHYNVLEEIGSGGMGVVYRAEDSRLGRDVALKVLSLERPLTSADRERFLEEGRMAASLRHPNICTVYDVGEEEGVHFIAMAYIPGENLKEIVSRGELPIGEAMDLAIQIATGLQAAHDRGIVHRDIKSANVIIDDDRRVSILDFGVAKLAGHVTQTGETRSMGTVAYMAPEQTSGQTVDARTDIWALGVCLYEMIAGELPFHGEHDSAVIYQIVNLDPPSFTSRGIDLPRTVTRIIKKALEKRPDKRYRIIDEMLADLKLAREELDSGTITHEPSIAVLPFTNFSKDPEQDYFCDGVGEEIINSLAQIEGLRVAARTSSFAFRGAKQDIREIGQKLDVNTILEGSVQKSGKRLRVTAQLINVNDGYHLWSQKYDRDLEDVFVIQDEIAQNIVRALEITLSEREERVIEKVPTTDMRAYDFYVRGLHHYHEKNRNGYELARNMFTSAIVRDPNYTLAYCLLADCYSMIFSFYNTDASIIENGIVACERAIEIDPDSAKAHASYGMVLSNGGQYDEAEREFVRAIELSPKLFEAHYFYARSCRNSGNLRKAAELFETASEMQPEDYEPVVMAADTYRGLNEPEKVEQTSRKGLSLVRAHLELHPQEARARYLGAHALFALGEVEEARTWNRQAMEVGADDSATYYNAACLFSLMGETDRCFECFDHAVEYGFANRAWLENDPDLEAVRSDPRYAQLVERISVPPTLM